MYISFFINAACMKRQLICVVIKGKCSRKTKTINRKFPKGNVSVFSLNVLIDTFFCLLFQ